jgi:hypothetical protein
VFTGIHQLLISSIWFALPAMLVAGALCGACLAGTYLLVAWTPSAAGWLRFNLLFLAMFVALGATSIAVFEPVTTIAALLQTNEPPRDLIGRALPMTAIFALAMALLLSALYRPRLVGALALTGTTVVLLLLLGLNISVLGLVEVAKGETHLLGATFGLLLGLAAVYALVVLAFARAPWSRAGSA